MTLRISALALALFACTGTHAAWPEKPLRVIVPFSPGGSTTDSITRAIAPKLADALGQPVLADNRPGAGGNLGSELVAKAAPDGYTLLAATAGPQTIAPSLYPRLGYDTLRDLAPVTLMAIVPSVIVVHPSIPANNLAELITFAKANPGKINYASTGTGGTPHLCGELLKSAGGINIVHVPYKGNGPATIDLLEGQVQLFCIGLMNSLPQIRAGKLRAIGAVAAKRSALMPDMPTLAEQGLAGFEVSSWQGVMVPARTASPVIARLHAEIAKIIDSPDMRKFLLTQGAEPALMDPAAYGNYLRTEIAKWAGVVKAAGIKVEE